MIDINSIRDRFQQRYGIHPHLIVRAPGRVNLIGEHTDYNDGFVLPAAIDRATYVAARRRDDNRVHVLAADFGDEDEFALDQIDRSTAHLWSNYVRGVAKGLVVAGHKLGGANLLITSDVPRGSGLSSSASVSMLAQPAHAWEHLESLSFSRMWSLEPSVPFVQPPPPAPPPPLAIPSLPPTLMSPVPSLDTLLLSPAARGSPV